MDGQWSVSVDRGACIGSGICAGISPRHFQLEGGKSRPVHESVDPEDIVLDAANLCPAEAIAVRDAAGDQLAP